MSGSPSRSHSRSKYVLAAKKFEFDEREARRARHRKQVTEAMLRKKIAKRTMRRIVESVKRTSEEHKELQVQNFIAEVQYNPNRKRLPAPPDIYSPSYDALLYLKGIPYMATEKMVFEWLKNYEIVNVVFIKNENGFFTGDAYVRCQNIEVRDKASREMANRMIGGRYIQVFRVNENAYLEYYHSGCRKEPKERNYIDPSVLVITNNQYRKLLDSDSKGDEDTNGPAVSFVNNINKDLDISDIRTGVRLVGTVTEIYRNGVIVECNISETRNGVKEKVFCILKKNRIAKNIGMQGQQHEWLRMKQLILYPGIRLNLYVEKIRETTAQNTFDEDMWTEHFEESLIETYFDKDLSEKKRKQTKRPLVYLTMDSSVSEDKVLWWEKKILNDVLSRHQTRNYEDIVLKEDIKETIKADRILTNKVKVDELHRGKTVVYGNQPNQIMLGKDGRELNDSNSIKSYESQEDKGNKLEMDSVNGANSNKAQFDLYNHSSIEQSGQGVNVGGKYMSEDYEHGSDNELPEDVPIENLLKQTRADNDKLFLLEDGGTIDQENQKEDKIEFVDLNYKKLAKRFFKNTTIYDKDIHFHDFDTETEDLEDNEESTESEESLDDYNWTLEPEARVSLNSFPKLSLTDGAIKIPPNGLILRESEVNKMNNEQVKGVLELLGKETKESYEENKECLMDVIRREGVPNESLPQALIQRGLQKVKRSRKYMKNIVNLTKDLTERKFSQEDLDAATTEELEMLVEDGLYKFLNWNPPFDIKKQFITNYHHLLEDNLNLPTISEVVPKPGFMELTEETESNCEENKLVDGNDEYTKMVEKMWNDMKWLIVIFIYGEQGDLEEIVEQLERSENTEANRKKLETLIIESKEG
ncbi:hypothetical protein MACJ_001889 [Theileria orientalis]|uniref:RRM domain-containing protein n=1 Tax=Theileria orientalis TaxID=68886 RepID=A0A976QQX7_THEOR|nr:hypothetical protein MACJ_001889 [Theileria orientalis]